MLKHPFIKLKATEVMALCMNVSFLSITSVTA